MLSILVECRFSTFHFLLGIICCGLKIHLLSSSSLLFILKALSFPLCCLLRSFISRIEGLGSFWSTFISFTTPPLTLPGEMLSWAHIAVILPPLFYALLDSIPQCTPLWASIFFKGSSWFSYQIGCFNFQQLLSSPRWPLVWLPSTLQFPSSSYHAPSAFFLQYSNTFAQDLESLCWPISTSISAISYAYPGLFPSADVSC